MASPLRRADEVRYRAGAALLPVMLLAACGGGGGSDRSTPPAPDPAARFPGGVGATTQLGAGPNVFGLPAPALDSDENNAFQVGNALFRDNWVVAGNSTTARDGLGPLFNARSCSSCHFRDGRGNPDPAAAPGLLFRLVGRAASPAAMDFNYGSQLQDFAVPGVQAEGRPQVTYTEEPGAFADGTAYSLRRPGFSFAGLRHGSFSAGVIPVPRLAPQLIGMGLLEAIPDAALQALADPDDLDGDGVSGRLQDVDGRIGRFGWKAEQPDVLSQIAAAFAGDIGITSTLRPEQPCTAAQDDCRAQADGGTPEIDDALLQRVEFYIQTLAVPARRRFDDPAVNRGEAIYTDVGCASCHVPRFETGAAVSSALQNQIIFPHTDLLLHDMGPDLAEDSRIGQASGSEWRTPPLWGLGLATEVAGGPVFFLHDGRARSISEAILWHGGEALAARDRFEDLSATDREELLRFLESL
ncbi:MAG: di-heme oxidoreductase family protein [Panacagrimonas sp.]